MGERKKDIDYDTLKKMTYKCPTSKENHPPLCHILVFIVAKMMPMIHTNHHLTTDVEGWYIKSMKTEPPIPESFSTSPSPPSPLPIISSPIPQSWSPFSLFVVFLPPKFLSFSTNGVFFLRSSLFFLPKMDYVTDRLAVRLADRLAG